MCGGERRIGAVTRLIVGRWRELLKPKSPAVFSAATVVGIATLELDLLGE